VRRFPGPRAPRPPPARRRPRAPAERPPGPLRRCVAALRPRQECSLSKRSSRVKGGPPGAARVPPAAASRSRRARRGWAAVSRATRGRSQRRPRPNITSPETSRPPVAPAAPPTVPKRKPDVSPRPAAGKPQGTPGATGPHRLPASRGRVRPVAPANPASGSWPDGLPPPAPSTPAPAREAPATPHASAGASRTVRRISRQRDSP
jgi:hypothetical protein